MFQLEKLNLEKNLKCFKESLCLNNINNYRIKNPFLVIKSFSTLGESDRAIDIAKNMALGAYYIKAIALIKNKVLNYQNISYSCLDKLKGIILHLINQLNNYINIIKDIQKYNNNHKLNENNFLLQQTFEKKNLMEDIYKNISENLNKINVFKIKYNDEYFKNFNITSNPIPNLTNNIIDGFDIRISDTIYYDQSEKHYNEDIIDYFLDYGLCEFFNVECKDKKCIIM